MAPPSQTLPPEEVAGYLRVTTVLAFFAEPTLVDWMVKKGPDAKKIAKAAMKVGTEVDEAIKEFIRSNKYGKVKTVEAVSCLDGFKRWYDDYRPSLSVGARLFNEEYKVTGEPDLYLGDRIIDIKCAREIRPKYHVQTGGYAWMADKGATGILRLHKQLGDYEYVERNGEQVVSDRNCFLDLLHAYNHLQGLLLGAKGVSNADSPAADTF